MGNRYYDRKVRIFWELAVDLDNNNIYFSVNGVWQNSGVPTSGATGTGAVAITVQWSTCFR